MTSENHLATAENPDQKKSTNEHQSANLNEYWDKIYTKNQEGNLGWFESDLSPTLTLLRKTGLNKTARVFIAGAGNTRLVDELLVDGYSNLIVTDISGVALAQLKCRVGDGVTFIQDDLTAPQELANLSPVDAWIDRAVLHFFTAKEDRLSYFKLVRQLVRPKAYALFAEFAVGGAEKCSGLSVCQYSPAKLKQELSDEFSLIESFDHLYTMPSGDVRPYIYALFRRS